MFAIRRDGFVDFDPVVRFVKNADCAGWLVVEAGVTPRSRRENTWRRPVIPSSAKFTG